VPRALPARAFSNPCRRRGEAPGSVLSFQVSIRCGLSSNARQIREIADWLMPVAAAIDRVDQCVSRPGLSSSVLVITSSTCGSCRRSHFQSTAASPDDAKRDSPATDSLDIALADTSRVAPGKMTPSRPNILPSYQFTLDDEERLAYTARSPRRHDPAVVDALAVLLSNQRKTEDSVGAVPSSGQFRRSLLLPIS
jgi:hypothetical protein